MAGPRVIAGLAKELIKTRHYKFVRHPLYSMKMAMGVIPGLASLNPVGWFAAAKTMYHCTKACELQDEKLRILHGEEALLF